MLIPTQTDPNQPVTDLWKPTNHQLHGPTIHPNGKFVYFSDWTDNKIRVVDVATDVMEAHSGSLFLAGVDGKLYISHARGIPPDIQKSTRITIGEGIIGKVAANRTPLILNGDVKRSPPPPDAVRRSSIRSSIINPLVSGVRLIGILTFNRTTGTVDFQQSDLNTVSVLASQIVLALDNSRLVRESATSERLAAVGQLAAGVAHEINTPVQFIGDNVTFLQRIFGLLATVATAAVGVLGALSEEQAASPEVLELGRALKKARLDYILPQAPRALSQAREGVQRIASIVGAMKEFAHPSADEKEPVDLAHLIAMTVEVARGEWKYVATVDTSFDPRLPPIPVLRDRLNQVLLNLIVNAAHAIGESAAKGSTGMGTIRLSTRLEGDWAVIEVSDTGAGIPEAILGRIFEPFFTTKPVGKGTGQGLAIAHNVVVEQHGGRVEVKSEVGEGTTFLLKFPVTTVSPPGNTAPSPG